MKLVRIVFALWLTISASAAFAMSQSSIPSKFGVPWANSAGSSYTRVIPQASQIGIQNCAASLTDGFPPLTFLPAAGGGCPPFGQDFNGILKQITQWSQWQAAGGPVFWDSAFNTSIGGYPKGAILQSSVLVGRVWFNTVDNNTTNPDDQTGAAANWIAIPGTMPAGTPVQSLTTAIPQGSVSANGLTVGNASSNATQRANADTFWLFSFLWNNCASCTLFNSGGGVVGKGATAVADWSSNHAIATINMNGAGLIGADSQNGSSSSNLSGVPIISGSVTVPGSFLGENLHALTAAQIPTLSATGSFTSSQSALITNGGSSGVGAAPSGVAVFGIAGNASISVITGSVSTSTTGTSGTAHNVVERSVLVYWNLQL